MRWGSERWINIPKVTQAIGTEQPSPRPPGRDPVLLPKLAPKLEGNILNVHHVADQAPTLHTAGTQATFSWRRGAVHSALLQTKELETQRVKFSRASCSGSSHQAPNHWGTHCCLKAISANKSEHLLCAQPPQELPMDEFNRVPQKTPWRDTSVTAMGRGLALRVRTIGNSPRKDASCP